MNPALAEDMLQLGVRLLDAAIPVRPRRDLVRSAATLTVAGVLGVAGAGCALAALWLAAIPYLGSAGAALVVAAVLFAGAGMLLGGLALARKRRAPPPPDPLAPLLSEARLLMQDHAGTTLLAALVAGFTAGQLRR